MLNREGIFNLFSELDSQLTNKTNIIILGGTFFVLKDLRESSKDRDIIVEGTQYREVSSLLPQIASRYEMTVDIMSNRTLGDIILPENYLKSLKLYRRARKLIFVRIWTLSPYFILISKISRYTEKDKKDIELILNSGKFTIRKRILKNNIRVINFGSRKNIFNRNYEEFLEKYGDKLKLNIFGY